MSMPKPGTYALVLHSTETAPIRVGKLGILSLQPGFYVYIGSAHGPGGLRALAPLRVIGLRPRIAPLLPQGPVIEGALRPETCDAWP